MGRLDGKVALISGAARGMGESHAKAIAAEGGMVVIGDVLDDKGQAVAAEIGGAAAYTHLDVTSSADWSAAVVLAEKRFGALNVLVNNAGVHQFSAIEDLTDEDWDECIAVNLTGSFKGIRAAAPALQRSTPASIINISSMAGMKGISKMAAYNAAKFGVRGLTKSVAIELAVGGVRVNAIAPGNVDTQMLDGFFDDDNFPLVPMHRVGQPHEISNFVVFLASDESSYATGAEFVADGGELAGYPNQVC